ncbi:MAG: polysaccharide deacetylase family protein [Pelistega sp.]|nr:polysaccharide deacetylase family protein [Pelistega sp.]
MIANSKTAQTVPVLMYHHVTPQGGSLSCSVKNFESQMRSLAQQGFTTLSGQQFADFMRGKPVSEKSVVLTFDDGYLNNFVYAHPILEKYNLHALMFIITGLMQEGEVRPTMASGHSLPASPGHYECKEIIQSGRAGEVMLRWSEIREMQACGTFEFHSHTNTHIRWDREEGGAKKNEQIRQDLQQSQDALRQNLGEVSEHFCWPQGYFDDDYVKIAKELGFHYLYTTEAYGMNQPFGPGDHIYRIAARNRGAWWLQHRLWWAMHLRFGPMYNQYKLKKKRAREQKRLARA